MDCNYVFSLKKTEVPRWDSIFQVAREINAQGFNVSHYYVDIDKNNYILILSSNSHLITEEIQSLIQKYS